MNKKGFTQIGITFLIAFFFFIAGMIFLNPITDDVSTARTSLNCGDSTISDGNKLTCLGIDLVVPYFILAIFSIAGGHITAKYIL